MKSLFKSIVISVCLFLSPTNTLAGQVDLAWDPPDATTDVSGYMIHYGSAPGVYTQGVDAGNATSYTVDNLTEGQTYYFAVTAYYSPAFESSYSNEVSTTLSQQYLLMISNPGQGTVSGPEISCGDTCLASYNSGTVVSLSATADPGSTFEGWSGGGCSGTGLCTTTMSANTTITANFKQSTVPTEQYLLMISNPGQGTVSGPGISCGDTCVASYNSGTVVSLSAMADPGSTFEGWSGGGCSGTGLCTTTMTTNTTITANFKPSTVIVKQGIVNYSITASVTGDGGTISPAGTSSVSSGSTLMFYITPETGYRIASVTVDGKKIGAVQSYTFRKIAANHSIGATFRMKYSFLENK